MASGRSADGDAYPLIPLVLTLSMQIRLARTEEQCRPYDLLFRGATSDRAVSEGRGGALVLTVLPSCGRDSKYLLTSFLFTKV